MRTFPIPSDSEYQPQANILTVDDDPDIGMALTDLLEGEGYGVKVVTTGREALDTTQRQHFDAVLLDVGLPDLNGMDVLHRMVKRDPQLPVILLTVYNASDLKIDPHNLRGAFAYLTKPFNREKLKATIDRAIGGKGLVTHAGSPPPDPDLHRPTTPYGCGSLP